LKEDFYHIFLLAKKGLAFTDLKSDTFNQDFVNKVIEKYENSLFNKDNFQIEKK